MVLYFVCILPIIVICMRVLIPEEDFSGLYYISKCISLNDQVHLKQSEQF